MNVACDPAQTCWYTANSFDLRSFCREHRIESMLRKPPFSECNSTVRPDVATRCDRPGSDTYRAVYLFHEAIKLVMILRVRVSGTHTTIIAIKPKHCHVVLFFRNVACRMRPRVFPSTCTSIHGSCCFHLPYMLQAVHIQHQRKPWCWSVRHSLAFFWSLLFKPKQGGKTKSEVRVCSVHLSLYHDASLQSLGHGHVTWRVFRIDSVAFLPSDSELLAIRFSLLFHGSVVVKFWMA